MTLPTLAPALEDLIECLGEVHPRHARTSATYRTLDALRSSLIAQSGLRRTDEDQLDLPPFGIIRLPYHRMGAVDRLDLFGLDELILFAFYWRRRASYRRVADLGANLGLHSIIMARCGFSVRAFEPDPTHFRLLERNLALNHVTGAEAVNAAVWTTAGRQSFTRVIGNTTSSHISGQKAPYGELETFEVTTIAMDDVVADADLIKMDVEGAEAALLSALDREQLSTTDVMLEIASATHAERIFRHLRRIGVNAFSQKTGWRRVAEADDIPTSYREGSLFVSAAAEMDWS